VYRWTFLEILKSLSLSLFVSSISEIRSFAETQRAKNAGIPVAGEVRGRGVLPLLPRPSR